MSESLNDPCDALIIGGGVSGSLLAAHLLRQPGKRRLTIVEPRAQLGRGEAYSASEPEQTLNANAARMNCCHLRGASHRPGRIFWRDRW